MLRRLPLLALALTVACSSGDDEVVTIPDSGVVDAGEVDAGVDAGVSFVEMQTFGANYTEQGCSNGCLIRNFALTVTLRNNSDVFLIGKVEGIRIQIGTFDLEQRGLNCDGNWWRAPKMGATAAQRITVNLFDVAEGDEQRQDNATAQFDCQADNDGMIVNMYTQGDTPESDTTVKATLWGVLEDNTAWEASGEVAANQM